MEVSRIICLGILIIVSIIDLKCRKIPVNILAAASAGALIYRCLCCRESMVLLAGGIGIGVFFLFISRITQESIGYGDSLGILCLGIYLGMWKLLEILAGAFFLLALCGIAVLIRKRMSRKSALPFYPFLAVSYAACLLAERGI